MIFKRITAFLLCVLLISASLAYAASAASRTETGMIDKYEIEDANPATFYTDYTEAIEALYLGMMDMQSSIDLRNYSVPVSSAGALFTATVHTHPELFFYERQYSISYYPSSGILTRLTPNYTNTQAEVAVMLDEFYAKADEYLALVNDDMDDFTKCLILHDALAINNEYDIERVIDGQTVDSNNYTFMVEGWGKCENYSECFAYLLAQLGIKSEIVTSDNLTHEWMKICLGGEDYYYNVDLTWDDPLYAGIGDKPGKVDHTYFLLSDSEFEATDAGREPHEFDDGYIHDAGPAYDGHDNLHSLENPFYWTAGALYTLYESNNKGYIATYDPASDTFTDKQTVDDVWHTSGGGWWLGNFSYIAEYEGLLYFNGENCVYVYNPETDEKTTYISNALTDGNQLYGLLINDGMLIGLAAANPNSETTQVLLGECMKMTELSAFTGHNLSVNGDIGLNYYISVPDEYVNAGKVSVTFTWTADGVDKTLTVVLSSADLTANGYRAYCAVSAAEMCCEVTATVTVDGVEQAESNTFSAKQYANTILFDTDFINEYSVSEGVAKYEQLSVLVRTMLDYGSKAQLRFGVDTGDLANDGTDYFYDPVTVTNTADDMSEDLELCGLSYVGSSVIYLSEMTLRHYYVVEDASLFTSAIQADITFGGSAVTYGEHNGMIYFEKTGIAASQLDTLYAISINGKDYRYSVLDYSALVIGSMETTHEARALAYAVYRYNAAANAFYGD